MFFKPVGPKTIQSEITPVGDLNANVPGYNQISSAMTFTVAQRDPNNGRAFSNLYSSFRLPAANFVITDWDNQWGNTALKNFDTLENVLVIEIPKDEYGELIDGRTIKLELPNNTGGTYTFYSSYYDGTYNASSDPSAAAQVFGHRSAINQGLSPSVTTPSTNVSFLFSDDFAVPTAGGSWADGFTTTSPPRGYDDSTSFFQFGTDTTDKKAANVNNSTTGTDFPLGVCYLDKGFIVITSSAVTQTLDYSASTAGASYVYSGLTRETYSSGATLTYWSFEKQWVLNVLCTLEPEEFYVTQNTTAADLNPTVTNNGEYDLSSVNKPVYISEIGLYDSDGDMLAIAKPDRPVEKYRNNPAYFNLKFRF